MQNRRQFLKLVGRTAIAVGALPYVAGCDRAQKISADAPAGLKGLAERFSGTLLLPGSDSYEKARRTFSFNPSNDRRPAVIARCINEIDVARALEFGRANDLEIAVRSGGHDVLAASTCDDGLLIDLADLNGIQFNGNEALTVVGPGATAGMLDGEMADQGHVVPLGCNPQVGVAGLTLGGGLGWFVGTLGATCDNLKSARIVTADGQILTVSEIQHPDLLWALRGGGGNFGIVVELSLKAHPATEVTGGYLCFDGDLLPEFLRFYRDYMADAPDALTVEVTVMAPARPVIFVMASFLGDPDEAQRALAPLKAFHQPLADGLRTAPYPGVMSPTSEVGRFFSPDPDKPREANDAPGVQWLGGSLDELSDAAIDSIIRQVALAQGNWAVNLGHYMHGAVCRVTAADSPLPRPCGRFTYNFATWWGSAANAQVRMAWVDGAIAALREYETASYINYLSRNDPDSVRQSYGESYTRLQAIKRRYDPDNVFHRNRNIVPG